MFDSFISLGWFCGTAASLSKYGLRSSSDPFDWYCSDLNSILHFIETDFSDFLLKSNLEEDADNPSVFRDVKYNLFFNHDVKQNFIEEYEDIHSKYLRRIEKFRVKIQYPTCFIRAVRDENELQYIAENQDYIKRIIKKGNDTNEIVFLIPQWIKMKRELLFPFFVLNIERYKSESKADLRGMLDQNDDVIEFLQNKGVVSNILSNLMFDIKKSWQKEEWKDFEILKYRYEIAKKLLNHDLNMSLIPDRIVIYGAGNIGKAFFNKCKDICSVECFIDAAPTGRKYKGVPILSRDRINEIVCDNIVVTTGYDMANIKDWFFEHYHKANLIVIDSLFLE